MAIVGTTARVGRLEMVSDEIVWKKFVAAERRVNPNGTTQNQGRRA